MWNCDVLVCRDIFFTLSFRRTEGTQCLTRALAAWRNLCRRQRQECGEECLEKATKVARFLDFVALRSK
jgi:hypothetical protein